MNCFLVYLVAALTKLVYKLLNCLMLVRIVKVIQLAIYTEPSANNEVVVLFR